MRIDAYAHIVPPSYLELLTAQGGRTAEMIGTWIRHSALSDISGRIGLLDGHGIEAQVVAPPVPPIDVLAEVSGLTPEVLVRTFNDGVATWVADGGGRFAGVGAVSLLDGDAAAREAERVADELGLVGIQVACGPGLTPLESPSLEPLLARAEELDLAVWVHPWRSPRDPAPDGVASARSQVPYILGWPFETTIASFCLAADGVMERHPGLRIVLHHAGGLTSLLSSRIDWLYTEEWSKVTGLHMVDRDEVLASLARFYVDTAAGGSTMAVSGAIEFFGPDRVVFGTDAPFGVRDGAEAVERAISSVETSVMDETTRQRVWSGNARAVLGSRATGRFAA